MKTSFIGLKYKLVSL